MRVALFLEDVGHESFIKSLVSRLADEEGLSLRIEVRNAKGGSPRLDYKFTRFLKDYDALEAQPDLLVVIRDTDCVGVDTIKARYTKLIENAGYTGSVVIGAPAPHIECWYLADPSALQRILHSPTQAPVPDSKCGKGKFKEILYQSVADAGVTPLLGGIEYATRIVGEMNIYRAAANVPSLDTFVRDVRTAFRPFTYSTKQI